MPPIPTCATCGRALPRVQLGYWMATQPATQEPGNPGPDKARAGCRPNSYCKSGADLGRYDTGCGSGTDIRRGGSSPSCARRS